MQLRVLRHVRLDEEDRLARIDACGEPVDHHVPAVLLEVRRALVVRGQRVPVGDEEKAGVFGLQADPVLEHSMVVPQMQAPRRPHAGEHSRFVHLKKHHGAYQRLRFE